MAFALPCREWEFADSRPPACKCRSRPPDFLPFPTFFFFFFLSVGFQSDWLLVDRRQQGTWKSIGHKKLLFFGYGWTHGLEVFFFSNSLIFPFGLLVFRYSRQVRKQRSLAVPGRHQGLYRSYTNKHSHTHTHTHTRSRHGPFHFLEESWQTNEHPSD